MMIIKKLVILSSGLLLVALSISGSAQNQVTQPIYLKVKPVRCISLHEGQQCYQDLQFTWNVPEGNEYCLYQLLEADNVAAIVCWNNNETTAHELEFVSDKNIIYQIRQKDGDQVLAKVEVEVAWVYKSGPNFNRWRLF